MEGGGRTTEGAVMAAVGAMAVVAEVGLELHPSAVVVVVVEGLL
jgi:hypothetical protein